MRTFIGQAAGAALFAVCLGALILASGCTLAPDVLTIDASHTEHEWGSAPYDFGKDTAGLGQHWKRGQLSVDTAVFAQQCKDGWRPEWNARASYAIPLQH